MSCLALCCRCSACCQDSAADKYPHIEYKSPADATGVVEEPEFYTIPLEQIFGDPHTHAQYAPHHPVTEDAVTDQPVSSRPADSGSQQSPARKLPRRFSTQMGFELPPEFASRRSSISEIAARRSICSISEIAEGTTSASSQSPPPAEQVPPCPIIQQSDVLPEAVRTSSVLQFSVYHDIQRSVLQVHLLRATKLLPVSIWVNKKSNVFVVMYLFPNKEEIYESRLVPSSTSPRLDQVFEVSGLTVEEIRRQSLVFRIYEGTQRSKGNFIGSVVLPLGEADLFGVITTMKIDKSGENLPGDSNGDLLLFLRYTPTIQLLEGRVVKVTNLHKPDIIGLADPYVKLYLLHKGLRQVKWKTSVKRNTLTPVFNESFQFDVSQMELADVALEAVVMDYNRFSRNDLVGEAFIGDHVLTASGRSHWAEVTSFPCVSVSRWHSVLPITSS